MIVAPGFERRALTPLTGVCVGVYGHRFIDLVQQEVIVFRTNNRFIERHLSQGATLYRSDRLPESPRSSQEARLQRAIEYANDHVFGVDEAVPFGRPIEVSHRFDENAVMDGLNQSQICYIARFATAAVFFRRWQSAIRRKR